MDRLAQLFFEQLFLPYAAIQWKNRFLIKIKKKKRRKSVNSKLSAAATQLDSLSLGISYRIPILSWKSFEEKKM